MRISIESDDIEYENYQYKMKVLNSKNIMEKISYIFGTEDLPSVFSKANKIFDENNVLAASLLITIAIVAFIFFSLVYDLIQFSSADMLIISLLIIGYIYLIYRYITKKNKRIMSGAILSELIGKAAMNEPEDGNLQMLFRTNQYGSKYEGSAVKNRYEYYKSSLNKGGPVYLNDPYIDFDVELFNNLLANEIAVNKKGQEIGKKRSLIKNKANSASTEFKLDDRIRELDEKVGVVVDFFHEINMEIEKLLKDPTPKNIKSIRILISFKDSHANKLYPSWYKSMSKEEIEHIVEDLRSKASMEVGKNFIREE